MIDNKKIALVTAITELSIEISTNSIIDIFVDFSSHIKGLRIKVILDGWNPEEMKTDFEEVIYLDWSGSEEKLNKVLDYLRKIKEEK
jgi:hypothetical protein